MKLRPLFSVFALGILVTGASVGYAQDEDNPLDPKAQPPRIYIGPVFGYNRAIHTGEFPSIPASVSPTNRVPCPILEGGTDNGYYVGMTMEYLLGKRSVTGEDPVSSVIGKIVYNSLPGGFELPGDAYRVIDTTTGKPENTTVKHVSVVEYKTVDLEMLYKLNLFGSRFGVIAGPTLGFSLGKAQQEQSFELVDPPSAQFEPAPNSPDLVYSNENRKITIRSGDLPGASSIRAALKAGVQYEQPLFNNKLNLIPHIFYNFGLTKLTDADNWRVNALQAGFDVRFAL